MVKNLKTFHLISGKSQGCPLKSLLLNTLLLVLLIKQLDKTKINIKVGGLVQDGGVEGRALIFSCKNTENKTIY